MVTGGSGNIGRLVVKRLLSRRLQVTVVDIAPYDLEEETKFLREYPSSFTFLLGLCTSLINSLSNLYASGDIRDSDVLHKAIDQTVQGVIHLAAVSRVAWCNRDLANCIDINERGTGSLETFRLILDRN